MSIRRVALPLALAGVVGAVCVLVLAQSPASARRPLSYGRLNKIQRRIISETLATALNPASAGQGRNRGSPGAGHGDPDQGVGTGRRPVHPAVVVPVEPRAARLASPPTSRLTQGQCSTRLGSDVKVNQNCLNVTDASLQGRGQANNEPSISQDPMNPSNIVASDNNYIRGDGTCGAHFSTDGGRTWADSTVPNGFTTGPTARPRLPASTGRPVATRRWRGTRAATRT